METRKMEQKRLPSTTDQQLIISNRQIKKKKPGNSELLIGRQGRVEDPACSRLFEIVDGHRFEKKQGEKSVSNGQQIIPFSRRRLRSWTVGG